MSKKIKIVGIQAISSNNWEENVQSAILYIEKNKGCDIIVFPELYLSGYLMEELHLKRNALDFSHLQPILLAALQNEMYIVISFVEKNSSGSLYNTTAFINPRGTIEGIHRKCINWKSELPYINEGILSDNLQVFSTPLGAFGILTCYEASFPELTRTLARDGVELLIVNANWHKDYLHHWKIQLQARALDNNIYLIGVNSANEDTCGNTMIINPDGEIISTLNSNEEGTLIAEINLNVIDFFSKKTPYLKDSIEYDLGSIDLSGIPFSNSKDIV